MVVDEVHADLINGKLKDAFLKALVDSYMRRRSFLQQTARSEFSRGDRAEQRGDRAEQSSDDPNTR